MKEFIRDAKTLSGILAILACAATGIALSSNIKEGAISGITGAIALYCYQEAVEERDYLEIKDNFKIDTLKYQEQISDHHVRMQELYRDSYEQASDRAAFWQEKYLALLESRQEETSERIERHRARLNAILNPLHENADECCKTCEYNAHSTYILCALNPNGPIDGFCQDHPENN